MEELNNWNYSISKIEKQKDKKELEELDELLVLINVGIKVIVIKDLRR